MSFAEHKSQTLAHRRNKGSLVRVTLVVVAGVAAIAVALTVAMSSQAGSGAAAALGPAEPKALAQTASFESPISPSAGNVGDKLVEYAENTSPASMSTTKSLLEKAAVDSNTLTQSGMKLDTQQAFTRETENGSLILRVPYVATANLLDISGYTVMFNPDGSIASHAEVIYQSQTEHSGRVALWQDGQLTLDQVVSDGVDPVTVGAAQPAFNWDTLNKCLTSAGIAQWAIIAIGIACGVVCGATLGIGCVACVAAAGGIIGATAGECVAKALIS